LLFDETTAPQTERQSGVAAFLSHMLLLAHADYKTYTSFLFAKSYGTVARKIFLVGARIYLRNFYIRRLHAFNQKFVDYRREHVRFDSAVA
jgi:hypothetical protein